MKMRKQKNRYNNKKRTLRSGKNKGKVNNQITSEQMLACIYYVLENHGEDIVKAAKDFYEAAGRGWVNIALTDHPDNPFKTGRFYYMTEEQDKDIQARNPFPTVNDRYITDGIATYEPETQAVVCIWYDTMYHVSTLTDTYAALSAETEYQSLPVN